MSAADSLGAWGILRPTEVVQIAASVGLSLPAAAVLLEKESGGGRNVWGSDPVPTGGAYRKGAVVTEADYRAYRRHLAGGTAGAQGVGPCQLTWRGYQDAADRIGGCWRWECNVRVGFETLRDLQRQHGVRGGFRRYNGSGPAAEKYADDAMARLARWADRLGAPRPTTPSPTPRPPAAPPLEDDMTPEESACLFEVRDLLRAQKPGVRLPGRSVGLAGTADDEFGWTMTAAGRADDAAAGVREVLARLDRIAAEPLDEALTVGGVRALIAEALAGLGPLYLTPERTTTS